jgi:hypothetical protein
MLNLLCDRGDFRIIPARAEFGQPGLHCNKFSNQIDKLVELCGRYAQAARGVRSIVDAAAGTLRSGFLESEGS